MIVGVDIGGTKTLLAVFTESGKLLHESRFETNKDYAVFLQDLANTAHTLETAKAKAACIAVPGLIDRQKGSVIKLGNLPWQNKSIAQDVSRALGISNVCIENDSKLAGIAEGSYLRQTDPFKRIYYITISTGIGGTLLIDGKIAQEVIDGEIGMVPVNHNSQMVRWEDTASGRAFYEKYGQKAADVDDPEIWEEFSQYIGFGISMICCIYQVEAIIFGGGLGQHLAKFKKYLAPYVTNYLNPTINRPKKLVATHYGDDAVIYGCYLYAKNHTT